MKIRIDQPYSFHQIGMRANQEDARYPDADAPSASGAPFFAVCDGVGGAEGGECASAAVCSALGAYMDDQDPELPFTLEDFQEGLTAAYQALYDTMRAKHNRDMATTLTFLYLSASGATMAHMGDSRIYQIRPGKGIVYRSEDHSLVNEMVQRGEITAQEAETHPMRNYITRCMCFTPAGAEMPYAEVCMTRDVRPGDCFFLCSDGVLHSISDADLVQLLCHSPGSDKEKMDMIAHESASSSDNNTATLVRVADVEPEDFEAQEGLTDEALAALALQRLGDDAKGLTIAYGITPVQPQAPASSLVDRLTGLFRKQK